ncbi:hypothetical protein [Polaribacter sp. Hel1_85]|uniref:hypothetical protein n=1 Tax=Polaribacter sp. Hel1_85 TaxID=1250005 RepID=UPI00052D9245|nr:hypothetical protein [Polaribacter sp. Hel1_85]KGL62430.1 hypothetical protein PHEL85_2224 [Polaribacter sp. Hel1_85]
MAKSLSNIKLEIKEYVNNTNTSELEVLEKLKTFYFNKKVNENLKLYKKGKKKVSDITKDLKISPRKFYAILEAKDIKLIKSKYNLTEKETTLK